MALSLTSVRPASARAPSRWWSPLLVLAVTACRPPDTSPRGFDSVQVAAFRDPGVRLGPFALDNASIYRMRTLAEVAVPDGVKPPFDLSRMDLGTGTETLVAPAVLSFQKVPANLSTATPRERSLAMLRFPSAADVPIALIPELLPPMVLTFLDEVTGATLDLDGIDSKAVQLGATRSDPILVGRLGLDRTSVPWFGAPEALMPLPAGSNPVGRDRLGVVALTQSPMGNTQQLTRFPFDDSPPVVLAPGTATNFTAVAGGAEGARLPPAVLPTAGVVARLSCPPATSMDPPAACLLFYDRVRADMSSAGFVRLVDETREFQLPGQLVGHLADLTRVAPDGRHMFWPAISSTTQTSVFTWQVGDAQAASCLVGLPPGVATFGMNAWRPGTGEFVAIAQPQSQSEAAPAAWTAIVGSAGTECHVIATGPNLIRQLVYAPDGARFAFLEVDPRGASKVYVAEADAPNPRLVAEGLAFFFLEFHDARRLLLARSTTDGYALSWLDVDAVPAPNHPIADSVVWDARTSWVWLNARTLLLEDATSVEDGSSSLHLVDIETGARRLISGGVVDLGVSWTKRPDDATELAVSYIVRGRTSSEQDGLWWARIGLSDFPP